MKDCELCCHPARLYCESDKASLCWDCDGEIHGANFLVARHNRHLLCHACQSPTPWKASGSKLAHTVSVCEGCVGRCGGKSSRAVEEEEGESRMELDDEDDEEESISDEDEGGSVGDDDGDNQVVPWTSSPPPPPTTSSSAEELSRRLDDESELALRRLCENENVDSHEESGYSSHGNRNIPSMALAYRS